MLPIYNYTNPYYMMCPYPQFQMRPQIMMPPPIINYKIFFWNVLCDQYSYDWKTAPHIELKYKIWDYRSKLIQNILSSKENESDLYCFVEVDKKDEIFNMINNSHIFYNRTIFEYTFVERPNSPLGIMLVYNKIKFTMIGQTKYLLSNNVYPNYALCAILQENMNINNKFCIIIVHLSAWEKNENIRKIQISNLMNLMMKDQNFINLGVHNFLICGDFNTGPESECIQMLKRFGYNSAFNYKENDDYTIVIDTVDEGLKKLKFDYIFGNKGIIFKNQRMAKQFLNFQKGIPNENFPSDHIYLQSDFSFIHY